MCQQLTTELQTLARVASHTDPDDLARRTADHERTCSECSPHPWRPRVGVPRDPDQETTP